MKKIFSFLFLFAASVAFGVAQVSIVPTANFEYDINHRDYLNYKYSIGTLIKQGHSAVGVWDFAKTGGAAGSYNVGIALPAKSIIKQVIFDVVTAPVGVFSTIAFNAVNAGDLKAALGTASWTGIVAGVPVGTAATAVKCTAACTLQATIASSYTAGKIKVFVDYYVSE